MTPTSRKAASHWIIIIHSLSLFLHIMVIVESSLSPMTHFCDRVCQLPCGSPSCYFSSTRDRQGCHCCTVHRVEAVGSIATPLCIFTSDGYHSLLICTQGTCSLGKASLAANHVCPSVTRTSGIHLWIIVECSWAWVLEVFSSSSEEGEREEFWMSCLLTAGHETTLIK